MEMITTTDLKWWQKHISVFNRMSLNLMKNSQIILEIKLNGENSLMISKGWYNAVNQRRTDNTMAKRKGTNTDLQNPGALRSIS
jgi:hypothetical protein